MKLLNPRNLYTLELTPLLIAHGAILDTECARVVLEYQETIGAWLAYGAGLGGDIRILAPLVALSICQQAEASGIPVFAASRQAILATHKNKVSTQ